MGVLQWFDLSEAALNFLSLAAHIIGFAGMGCVVLAFWLVVNEKWKPTSLAYNLLNGTGAVLLILSLLVHFNLGSFVIEIFWIAISATGVWKHYRAARRKE